MNFNNILFLDIETVSQYETYQDMCRRLERTLGSKGTVLIRNKETETAETVYRRRVFMPSLERSFAFPAAVCREQDEEKNWSLNLIAVMMKKNC